VQLQHDNQQQTQVLSSVVREAEQTKGSWIRQAASHVWTVQGALIGLNMVMAFRGIQIWNIIQRVKVISVVQRLRWLDPVTRAGARLLMPITSPIRVAVKPLTLYRARLARKAEEQALRELAARRAQTLGVLVDNPLTRSCKRTWHAGMSSISAVQAHATGWRIVGG